MTEELRIVTPVVIPIRASVSRRLVFFFFSSRRRHTRCSRDWSSDVCSSDLFFLNAAFCRLAKSLNDSKQNGMVGRGGGDRSEERRVGKECRSRWSPYH